MKHPIAILLTAAMASLCPELSVNAQRQPIRIQNRQIQLEIRSADYYPWLDDVSIVAYKVAKQFLD